MDDVACRGDEARLQDCRHLSSDDCDSSEGAGVICRPRITTPSPPPTTKSPLQCEVGVHNGDWALSGVDDQFHMRNILYDACDHFYYLPSVTNYWLAPVNA